MNEPQIINYKNKQVVFLDYSKLKTQKDIIELIDKGSEYIKNQPKKSVLSLIDANNMHFNRTIKNYLQFNVRENSPYVKRTAVYGISGLLSIMFNGLLEFSKRDIKTFNSKEEALEYLIG